MKDPTPRMLEVLRALVKADGRSMTGNQIARACGFDLGQDKSKHSHNGRAMAPAQRVIFAIIGLRKRGLVGYGTRRDKLSGTAFVLTGTGRTWCRQWGLK